MTRTKFTPSARRSKTVLGVLVVAFLAAAGLLFFYPSKEQQRSEFTNQAQLSLLSGAGAPSPGVVSTPAPTKKLSLHELREQLDAESKRMAMPDENPAETFFRLQAMADGASGEGLRFLAERSLQVGSDQDERFLASMVLALHRGQESIPLLKEIALSPFTPTDMAHDARGAVEWMVRAQAIEGFEKFSADPGTASAAKKALEEISRRVGHDFLATRARQALETFKRADAPEGGKLPPLPERDKTALRKLIDQKGSR